MVTPATSVLTGPDLSRKPDPEELDPGQWVPWLNQQSTLTRPDRYCGDKAPGGGAWDAQAVSPRLRSYAHGDDNDAVLKTVGPLAQERWILSGKWDRMIDSTSSSQ